MGRPLCFAIHAPAVLAGKSNQLYFPDVARLKAHSRTGSNIQTKAPGRFAVEVKRIIDFVEMKMTADLHRAITRVGHSHADRGRPALPDSKASGSLNLYSPGIIGLGYEWLPVLFRREGALDLYFMNHLRHAFHYVRTLENRRTGTHQIGHAFPVANALQSLVS